MWTSTESEPKTTGATLLGGSQESSQASQDHVERDTLATALDVGQDHLAGWAGSTADRRIKGREWDSPRIRQEQRPARKRQRLRSSAISVTCPEDRRGRHICTRLPLPFPTLYASTSCWRVLIPVKPPPLPPYRPASTLFSASAMSRACSTVMFMLKSNRRLRPRMSSVCGHMSLEYSTFPL